jgi:hypothetical protein
VKWTRQNTQRADQLGKRSQKGKENIRSLRARGPSPSRNELLAIIIIAVIAVR